MAMRSLASRSHRPCLRSESHNGGTMGTMKDRLHRFASIFVLIAAVSAFLPSLGAAQQRPPGVPEAGKDARIDEIIKRGTLRVGVTPVFPWVFRNKTGSGDEYRGSSWALAKAYAEALGVKLEVVQVSNET